MLNDKGKALLRLVTMLLIQFAFIMLKITGVINWSWVIVLVPVWIIIFWELFSVFVFLIILRK
jgi:hypothetical protein